MRYEWPSKTLILPLPMAFLLGWAKDTLTTWLNDLAIPDWLPVLLVGIFAGLLINDVLNSRSWLRHNWRVWRRLFDVETTHAGHHQSSPEHIELVCLLRFRKTVKDAQLTVSIVTPSPTREDERRISHSEVIDVIKDSRKRLMLGSIAITRAGDSHACHSVWGEGVGETNLNLGRPSIIGLSRVVIEVKVNHQIYRIYAHILDPNREESSRVYLLSEDQFPALI